MATSTNVNCSNIFSQINEPSVDDDGEFSDARVMQSISLLRTHQEMIKRRKAIDDELEHEKHKTIHSLVQQLTKQKKNDEIITKCIDILQQVQDEFQNFKKRITDQVKKEIKLGTVDKAVQWEDTYESQPQSSALELNLKKRNTDQVREEIKNGIAEKVVQCEVVYESHSQCSNFEVLLTPVNEKAEIEVHPESSSSTNAARRSQINSTDETVFSSDVGLHLKFKQLECKELVNPFVCIQTYKKGGHNHVTSNQCSEVCMTDGRSDTKRKPIPVPTSDRNIPLSVQNMDIQSSNCLSNSAMQALSISDRCGPPPPPIHDQQRSVLIVNANEGVNAKRPKLDAELYSVIDASDKDESGTSKKMDVEVEDTRVTQVSPNLFPDSQISIIPESQPSSYKTSMEIHSSSNCAPQGINIPVQKKVESTSLNDGIGSNVTTAKRKVWYDPKISGKNRKWERCVQPTVKPPGAIDIPKPTVLVPDAASVRITTLPQVNPISAPAIVNATTTNSDQRTTSSRHKPGLIKKSIVFSGGLAKKNIFSNIYKIPPSPVTSLKNDCCLSVKKISENKSSAQSTTSTSTGATCSRLSNQHTSTTQNTKSAGTFRTQFLDDFTPFEMIDSSKNVQPKNSNAQANQFSRQQFTREEITKIQNKMKPSSVSEKVVKKNAAFVPPPPALSALKNPSKFTNAFTNDGA